MKKIFIGLSTVCILLSVFTGCEEGRTTYEGPNYVMFSDTLSVLGVQNSEEYFDVAVTATQTCGYDRILGVEILDKKSNAVEGYHYTLASSNVIIKAGERVGNIRVRGIYDHIGVTDSLGFVLQLTGAQGTPWSVESDITKVILKKVCPFDINSFTRWAVLTSTYMQEFMQTTSMRLIFTEKDPEEENCIIMKDCFYDGYDMKIRFTTKDPLNPLIEMKDQTFASTAEAFGTIYGDGVIKVYQPKTYVSYYSSCERFIFQYMTLHVPGMEEGDVAVGTFVNAVEWVSDDEAKKLQQQGF